MTATLVSLRQYWRVFASIAALLAVVAAYSIVKNPVSATHTPADKVAAAGEEVEDIPSGDGVTILSATLRTSKPSDLIMSVTLECAILTKLFTDNTTADETGVTSTASTNASIVVWIEDEGGNIVPISGVSSPPQDPEDPGEEDDKVTFCKREEGRRVTDEEDPLDGVDAQQTYQDTKTANAFNWILMNAGSGVHTYNVKASLSEDGPCATGPGFATEETCSDALIGNRIFIIQPVKMASDASI